MKKEITTTKTKRELTEKILLISSLVSNNGYFASHGNQLFLFTQDTKKSCNHYKQNISEKLQLSHLDLFFISFCLERNNSFSFTKIDRFCDRGTPKNFLIAKDIKTRLLVKLIFLLVRNNNSLSGHRVIDLSLYWKICQFLLKKIWWQLVVDAGLRLIYYF